MLLTVKRLDPRAKIPTRAHEGDAGLDLYAIEETILTSGVPEAVRTGLALEIPAGYYGAIVPRSGLALKHGITVVNAPGTIDAGYRGEVKVIMRIGRKFGLGSEFPSYHRISPGDRIAQLIFHRCEPVDICEGELSETERGEGGFGSSGK